MTAWEKKVESLKVLHSKGLVSDEQLRQGILQSLAEKARREQITKKAQNTMAKREAIASNDYLLFHRSITREQWLSNNRDIEREYGH